MVRSGADSNRVRPGAGIATSVFAGLLFSSAMLIAKTALANAEISAAGIALFITNPVVWAAAITGLIGLFAMQYAFRFWHMSAVIPLITGIVTLASNVLAFAVLQETVSIYRWAGVALILIGIILFVAKASAAGKIKRKAKINPGKQS